MDIRPLRHAPSSGGTHRRGGDDPLDLGSRERRYLLLNEPETSVSASVISVFVLILIVISTLTFCLETLPEYYTAETELSNPFWVVRCVCIVFFTLEFVLRHGPPRPDSSSGDPG